MLIRAWIVTHDSWQGWRKWATKRFEFENYSQIYADLTQLLDHSSLVKRVWKYQLNIKDHNIISTYQYHETKTVRNLNPLVQCTCTVGFECREWRLDSSYTSVLNTSLVLSKPELCGLVQIGAQGKCIVHSYLRVISDSSTFGKVQGMQMMLVWLFQIPSFIKEKNGEL